MNPISFETYKSFSHEECLAFQEHLKRFGHSSKKSWLFICHFWDTLDKESYSKQNNRLLHDRLFGDKKFQDVRIRQLYSALYKEMLLLISKWQLNLAPLIQQQLIASYFREKQLDKQYEIELNKWRALFDSHTYENEDTSLQRYLHSAENYTFISKVKRSSRLNLQAVSDNLDVFYLSAKLKRACHMMAHRSVYDTEYDLGLLKGILHHVKEGNYLSFPSVSVYYYGLLAVQNPNKEHYFTQLKSQILKYASIFDDDEVRDIYLLAINYCIQRLNHGQLKYANEGLELYQSALDFEVLYENEKLNRFTYANIVGMAIRLKKLAWANDFIEKYASRLENRLKEETYHFNLARVLYARQDFDKAMIMLQKSDYEDVINAIIAKTLLMKIYYEKGEFELLDYHLDAMLVFIGRKKIIGYHQKNYLNIVRFTKRLVKLNPGDSMARQKFIERAEREDVLTEKEWILAQATLIR